MKYLLDNTLAPLTFACGFLELPFSVAGNEFVSWRKTCPQGVEKKEDVCAPLPDALRLLAPLTTCPERILLLEAGPSWTAYFDNSINGPDPSSPIGHLSQALKCHGLRIDCQPKIVKNKKIMRYGAVIFELFGPEQTDWLNQVRTIALVGDYNGWTFETGGEPLPFETPEKYKAKRMVDRFTPEMLEEYVAALGIRLFDTDFYGPHGVLITLEDPQVRNPGFRCLTLEEAQSFHGIK